MTHLALKAGSLHLEIQRKLPGGKDVSAESRIIQPEVARLEGRRDQWKVCVKRPRHVRATGSPGPWGPRDGGD